MSRTFKVNYSKNPGELAKLFHSVSQKMGKEIKPKSMGYNLLYAISDISAEDNASALIYAYKINNKNQISAVQMAESLAVAGYHVKEVAVVLRNHYKSDTDTAEMMYKLLVAAYSHSLPSVQDMAKALGESHYNIHETAVVLCAHYPTDAGTAIEITTLIYNAYQTTGVTVSDLLRVLVSLKYNSLDVAPAVYPFFSGTTATELASDLVSAFKDSSPLSSLQLAVALNASQINDSQLSVAVKHCFPDIATREMAAILLITTDPTLTQNIQRAQKLKSEGKSTSESALNIVESKSDIKGEILAAALISVFTPDNITESELAIALCNGFSIQREFIPKAQRILASFPIMQPDVFLNMFTTYTPQQLALCLVKGFPNIDIHEMITALKHSFAESKFLNPIFFAKALKASIEPGKDPKKIGTEIAEAFELTLAPHAIPYLAVALKAIGFDLEEVSIFIDQQYFVNKPEETAECIKLLSDVYKKEEWDTAIGYLTGLKTLAEAAKSLFHEGSRFKTDSVGFCFVLATVYYQFKLDESLTPMTNVMKEVGYSLDDIILAMSKIYKQEWSPQDIDKVKDFFHLDVTYYLDAEHGSDIYPGTSDEPWQTLQHALSVVTSGDTVIMRDGEYGPFNDPTYAPSRDDWIVFRADEGAAPVIKGVILHYKEPADAYLRIDGLSVVVDEEVGINLHNARHVDICNLDISGVNRYTALTGIKSISCEYVLISHNHIHSVQRGVLIIDTADVVISFNHIHDLSGGTGIMYDRGNTNGLITGNNIYDSTQEMSIPDDISPLHSHGIFVCSGDLIISNNVIHNIGTSGISCYKEPSGESFICNIQLINNLLYDIHNLCVLRLKDVEDNIVLKNNTVIGKIREDNQHGTTRLSIALLISMADGFDGSDVALHNNIFAGMVEIPVAVDDRNNIFWSICYNNENDFNFVCETEGIDSVVVTCNADFPVEYFKTDFFVDSINFADGHEQILDFHLASESPAVNFGNPSLQPETAMGHIGSDGFIDQNGPVRDAEHHSAGCYEFEYLKPLVRGIGISMIL